MRLQSLLLVISLWGLSTAAPAILPNSFFGWTAPAVRIIAAKDAEQVAPANASILREYGLDDIEQAEYARGHDSLVVTLYHMKDPTAGYGAFTLLRTEDMKSEQIGDLSSVSPQRGVFLRGNLVIEVAGENLNSRLRDLQALVSVVFSQARTGPYPSLPAHFPTEGLVPNSERYILGVDALQAFAPLAPGDWAGFSDGAEAEVAKYKLHGEELSLILIDFPTPQAAEAQLENYCRKFTINPPAGKSSANAMYARRAMTLVALVSGARSMQIADGLLRRIHSGEELTWNEPSFELTQPAITTIVVGAIIGAGILSVYAFVAGLAFGGFRVLIMRMLPGRIFLRKKTTEVLQLGITTKPVDTNDLHYGG